VQEAIAAAFEHSAEDRYFSRLLEFYSAKRQRLLTALYESGLTPVEPEGCESPSLFLYHTSPLCRACASISVCAARLFM
jgi:aspartate/methionine/tyrosine aminotransferase